MHISFRLAIAAFSIAGAAAPVLADNPVQAADERVAQTRSLYVKAQASGDVVTIATARAKFQAAQATAWGARHPANKPVQKFVAQRQ